jgi:hypothetical protein
MKKVFILTRDKERFDALHNFLITNDFPHEQQWEGVESVIEKLKYLEVDFKETKYEGETTIHLKELSEISLKKMQDLLKGNSRNPEMFPTVFIVDLNLLFHLTAEHMYKLIVKTLLESLGEIPNDFRFMYLLNMGSTQALELNRNVGYIKWLPITCFDKIEENFKKRFFELVMDKNSFWDKVIESI